MNHPKKKKKSPFVWWKMVWWNADRSEKEILLKDFRSDSEKDEGKIHRCSVKIRQRLDADEVW
jgi:hypothetical protein